MHKSNTVGSTDDSAHTCRYCISVVIERPSQQRLDEAEVGDVLSIAEIDGSAALLAATDGCTFFRWAVARFDKHEDQAEIDDGWLLRVGVLEGHLRKDGPSFPFVDLQWNHESGAKLGLGWLGIIAEKDDPAALYISMRPTKRSMESEELLSLAQSWLSDCQTHHDRCNAVAHRTMPSRVIEISWMSGALEPSLRLLLNPPWENYVALSYCWGNDQPVKSTTSTIHQFSEAIPFSELPKSLRDAVITAWRLSMRLLWIDSLCIMQGNPHDTAVQIALMPQIYQNAHVTISVARSSSSKHGFLHDLSVPSAQADVFKLPFRCPEGSLGTIKLFHEPDFWDPIERRAWPLQEYLLSRRVLKYGSYRLSWSCLSVEFQEDDATKENWFSRRDQRFLDLRRRFLESQKNTGSKRHIWRDLVREYTSRNLTEDRDRLLAISGIATALGIGRNNTYLGGLWLEDLPLDLLWEVTSPLQPRPREYRAPSWSWASVDGTVECFANMNVDPDLRLLSYEVTPTQEEAQYGALEAGHLEILGRMRSAYWIEDRETLVDTDTGDAVDNEALAITRGDAIENVSTASILVWCLQICPYDPILDEGPFGLILTTEDDTVFRRVGMFSFDPAAYKYEESSFRYLHREAQQKWASGCQLRKIIIK